MYAYYFTAEVAAAAVFDYGYQTHCCQLSALTVSINFVFANFCFE